jgi:hypothetical protein
MIEFLLSPQDEYLRALDWRVSSGYVRRDIVEDGVRRAELLHRVVTAAPDGLVVDHINGDTTDNRRENLRVCTNAENLRNRRIHKNNKAGIKGVYRDRNKFRAQISFERRQIHIGTFDTAEEAKSAYDKYALELHGEFARLA